MCITFNLFSTTACPSKDSFIHYPILISVYTMIILKSSNLEYYLSVLPSKILLIFASPTCPACKVVVPQVEKQVGDQIEILYIDGNKWEKIADQYDIDYYPTLILLRNGKEINRIDKVKENNITKILK